MRSPLRTVVVTSALLLGLLGAPHASAGEIPSTLTSDGGSQHCGGDSGIETTCSTSVSAAPGGAFGGSVTIDSLDWPLQRNARSAMALARYRIGFNLDAPASEVDVVATLHLDDAAASWEQNGSETFGGDTSNNSKARVLFQLLGHDAPSGCGCGFFTQGSGNVVVAEIDQVGDSVAVSGDEVQVKMTARNLFGDALPMGHYEILFRGYALADMAGQGDWGTMSAAVNGRIDNVSVSTSREEEDDETPAPTNLTLSVDGSGANRVLTAVLSDDDSARIEGRTISFYGEDVLLGTRVTDDTGTATLAPDGRFRGGSRAFSAEFVGDETYEASSAEARS